jgi:hypothetical protein
MARAPSGCVLSDKVVQIVGHTATDRQSQIVGWLGRSHKSLGQPQIVAYMWLQMAGRKWLSTNSWPRVSHK